MVLLNDRILKIAREIEKPMIYRGVRIQFENGRWFVFHRQHQFHFNPIALLTTKLCNGFYQFSAGGFMYYLPNRGVILEWLDS